METCGKVFDPNTKEEIDGVKEYYQCKMCKKYYSDSQGKNEILNLEAWKKGAGKLEKLPTYQIIEGMNGKWNKGSKDGLTFKSNGGSRN